MDIYPRLDMRTPRVGPDGPSIQDYLEVWRKLDEHYDIGEFVEVDIFTFDGGKWALIGGRFLIRLVPKATSADSARCVYSLDDESLKITDFSVSPRGLDKEEFEEEFDDYRENVSKCVSLLRNEFPLRARSEHLISVDGDGINPSVCLRFGPYDERYLVGSSFNFLLVVADWFAGLDGEIPWVSLRSGSDAYELVKHIIWEAQDADSPSPIRLGLDTGDLVAVVRENPILDRVRTGGLSTS